MKKLSFVLLIVVSVASIYLYGCQKDVTVNATVANANQKDVIALFVDLKANVTASDGVLTFSTPKDLERTVKFLEHAPKDEITKWEATLQGFISVTKNFVSAKEDLMDVETKEQYEMWQRRYADKVAFQPDSTFRPLIDNGSNFGRIISEKGMYKVGKSIVQYWNDKVISIADGDLQKLEEAKNNPEMNKDKSVYIHDLFKKTSTEANRNGSVELRTLCSNSCPGLSQQTINNGKYRIRCYYNVVDNSGYFQNNGFCNNPDDRFYLGVKVEIVCDVDMETKKWYGWAGNRAGFTWDMYWDIEMFSANLSNGSFAGGRSQNNVGWYTEEAFLNHTQTVFDDAGCTKERVDNLSFSRCIHRIGMSGKSTNPVINNVRDCQR
jgi:hypothetical protein